MTFSTPSTRVFAAVAVVFVFLVSGTSSKDYGPPLLEVIPNIGNALIEAGQTIALVPRAVGNAFKAAGNAVRHPVKTTKAVVNAVRPDHVLKKIFHPPINCSCSHIYSCECCVHIFVPLFESTQHVCYNITVNPANLSANIGAVVNNRSIIQTILTGSHPPALCVAAPNLPIAALCARLHDLGFEKDGFRICLNNEIQLLFIRLFVLRYDCIRVGRKGVRLLQDDELIARRSGGNQTTTESGSSVDETSTQTTDRDRTTGGESTTDPPDGSASTTPE